MLKIPLSPHTPASMEEIRVFIDSHLSMDRQIELKDTYLDTISSVYESPVSNPQSNVPERKMLDYDEEVAEQIETVVRFVFGETDVSEYELERAVKWLHSNRVVFAIHLSFDDLETYPSETIV